MTDRLSEIEARLKAATPGPWFFIPNNVPWNWGSSAGSISGRATNRGNSQEICAFSFHAGEAGRDQLEPNGELIAHAPADLAWAVAEIKRLREKS